MGPAAIQYRWKVSLRSSPAAIWPYVADIRRFSRDVGLPPIRPAESDVLPGGRRRLLCSLGWRCVVCEQSPLEWVWPQGLSLTLSFQQGPVVEASAAINLQRTESATVAEVTAGVLPRGMLGWWVARYYGRRVGRALKRVLLRYDALAHFNDRVSATDLRQVRLAPGGYERLASGCQALVAQGAPLAIIDRLRQTLEGGDDLAAARLRPFELADAWDLDRRTVSEVFLLAARLGLLELNWDVLCPLCRQPAQSVPSLLQVHATARCPNCGQEFAVTLNRDVELTFRAAQTIRLLDSRDALAAGPASAPHIAAQVRLPPGQRRELTLSLEPGRYRARAWPLARPVEFFVVAARTAAPAPPADPRYHSVIDQADADAAHAGPAVTQAAIEVADGACHLSDRALATSAMLTLRNRGRDEALVALERAAPDRQSATALEIALLQRFRELYPEQTLSSDQRLAVGPLAVLFTNVVGFDALCRRAGDMQAVDAIAAHADILRNAATAESGCLLKIIGDRAMCVFEHPLQALRAALIAQHALAQRPHDPIAVRAALHYGPCVAVSLNDRLDFIGAAVNLAAVLVEHSTGSDVVVTQAVHDDPLVELFLNHPTMLEVSNLPPGLRSVPDEVSLKGRAPLRLWRIERAPDPAQAPLSRPA